MANRFVTQFKRTWLLSSFLISSIAGILSIWFVPWSAYHDFLHPLHHGLWDIFDAGFTQCLPLIGILLFTPVFAYFFALLCIAVCNEKRFEERRENCWTSQVPKTFLLADGKPRQWIIGSMTFVLFLLVGFSVVYCYWSVKPLFVTEAPPELLAASLRSSVKISLEKKTGLGFWPKWSVYKLKSEIESALKTSQVPGQNATNDDRFRVRFVDSQNAARYVIEIEDTKSGISRLDYTDQPTIDSLDREFSELECEASRLSDALFDDFIDEVTIRLKPTLSNLDENYPLIRGTDVGLDLPLRLLYLFELRKLCEDVRADSKMSAADRTKLTQAITSELKQQIPRLAEVRKIALTNGYRLCYLRWYDVLLLFHGLTKSDPSLAGVGTESHTLKGSITACLKRLDAATISTGSKANYDGTDESVYFDGSIAAYPLYALLSLNEEGFADYVSDDSAQEQLTVYGEVSTESLKVATTPFGADCEKVCRKMVKTFVHSEVRGDDFVGGKSGFVYQNVELPNEPLANGRVGTRAFYHIAKAVARQHALQIMGAGDDKSKIDATAREAVVYCDLARLTIENACNGITNQSTQGAYNFDRFYCYCFLMRAAAMNARVASSLQRPDIARKCVKCLEVLHKAAAEAYAKDPSHAGEYSLYYKPLGDLAAFRRLSNGQTWKKSTYNSVPHVEILRELATEKKEGGNK